MAGTQNFTIAAPNANAMPTGYFQVGNSAVLWSDIENGSNPIQIYDVDSTTSPPTYTAGATTGDAEQPALHGRLGSVERGAEPADGSAAVVDRSRLAGYTVSTISGTTGNPTTVTLSSTGTAAPVFADATDGLGNGATGEVLWADGQRRRGLETGRSQRAPTAPRRSASPSTATARPPAGSNIGLSNALPGIIPTSMGVTWANGAENSVQNPAPNTAQQSQIHARLRQPEPDQRHVAAGRNL